MNARVLIAVLLLGALAAGVRSEPAPPADTYVWRLPRGVPHPKVPADNPMSEAKVRLASYAPRLGETFPLQSELDDRLVQLAGIEADLANTEGTVGNVELSPTKAAA